jgi:hypothetical protein
MKNLSFYPKTCYACACKLDATWLEQTLTGIFLVNRRIISILIFVVHYSLCFDHKVRLSMIKHGQNMTGSEIMRLNIIWHLKKESIS